MNRISVAKKFLLQINRWDKVTQVISIARIFPHPSVRTLDI